MQLADQKQSDRDELEPILYAALINSMVQNFWAIFLGSASAAVAAVMTALKTGDARLWPIAFLLIAIGTARAFQMRSYENRTEALSFDEATDLAPRYWAGALSYAAVLGVWAFVVIYLNEDPVADMLCVAIGIGYTAGGAARNYGQPRVVQWHVALACGPMSLALLMHGGPYHIGLAILLAFFFVGLKNINLSLHAIFVKALTSSFRESALASQFDTALNNMPHGLCMFRADGRLAVMNHRFGELMQLPEDLVKRGATAVDIVSACVAAGTISVESGNQVIAEIEHARIREIVSADPDTTRGRALAWTFQPMARGGTVVLLEDITERTNAEARISHLARYDELTALPNRVSFRDEIERLLAQSHHSERLSALLFIDLDQFKQVNDTLGHPCGDQLLCAVANRLREMLRPEDFVARFGGDEFVVYQQNINSPEDAASLARRIVERLSERYRIDNHLVEIGASVGISLTSPKGTSADTLLKNADMALYRAKADGRGTFCFFRDEMAATVEARRILELDLRKALANEEFELFYQPLVNLKSGKITTCEALLRWNHPVRGTVSPIDIVPVAEDMGLIVDLGRWILRRACMECMKWPEGVSVAVNFSPQQFHQRDVLSEIRYALEVSGLPAHRLEIEITESSLLRNTQLTHDILSQLHALGVRISLDDFGTGYSSLSYLHNFPMQKVKIDRSFLEGIDTDRPLTLLRGVARLSADLGMSVVVEGIETNEQLELISADGTVTEAQGYLFSRPVPAVRMRQLLNASHGRRGENLLQVVGARSFA
ncbi:EAL domain-containing protein [Bradyrhizobium sp. Gha]|uniref:putative bifunctional diguanylate cyclase/phosphodiesterase n=1 Tax=Bradyrhizobium sp. Gha TaxID=1855318 RepID=UPI0008EE0756|nr:EAL domain-containing protein [Bradyrhizobium sp. Gha]SFH87921.1 diguanylate cyclase (GGDEF) domain-containing protein [Bradyrhizobium sp. Gha]